MQQSKYIFYSNVAFLLIILLEVIFGISLFLQRNKIAVFFPKQDSLTKSLRPENSELQIFYEKIPGSTFHGPDATWWGYNQSKIVRFNNLVFMYVIENIDDKNTTTSPFVIYKKEGDFPWEKGASFTTSRPGNIVIDSKGILHAFVFEPVDVAKNDSWGKLKHYWFPHAAKGDITNYQEEIVINNNGTNETVNIRIGAAVGLDDTLAFAFGMGKFNILYKDFSEHLYIKKPTDTKWTHLIAGEELGHEYYYPFVWMGNNEYYLLPVQDDYNGQGTPALPYPNIYQKIMYFVYKNGEWNRELIADLSNHPLAKSRPRLLEQEDLYLDKKGTMHILYKEFLDSNTQWGATHVHIAKNPQGSSETRIVQEKDNLNWIRLFEVNDTLYYLFVYHNSAYVKRAGTETLVKLSLPSDARGMYPYIATSRGGTRESKEYVDILFLAADQYDYRDGTNVNYYIRIPKSELVKFK